MRRIGQPWAQWRPLSGRSGHGDRVTRHYSEHLVSWQYNILHCFIYVCFCGVGLVKQWIQMYTLEMDEQQAENLAKAVGGEVWKSSGAGYVVGLRRPGGSIVVFSDDVVAEYADDSAFDAAKPSATIMLRDDPTEYWVVQDEQGGLMLADPDHGRGWPSEEEAEHEARGIQSRTGLKTWVRRQRLEDILPAKSP